MGLQHHITTPPGVDLNDLDIVMSNALVLSAHGLILSEKRLIAIAMAKTRVRQWPPGYKEPLEGLTMRQTEEVHAANWDEWAALPDSPFVVRISAQDYSKHFNVSIDSAYEQLASSVDKLERKRIRMPIKTPKGTVIESFGWAHKVRYTKGLGYVELIWHAEVANHLFGYGGKTGKGKFTRYKLGRASMFDSYYTWRLFELFVSVKGAKYTAGIDDFLMVMDAPETYSKDFFTIRRRIINVAVDELNERHNLKCEWDTVRAGRKVVGLSFVFDADVVRRLGELNPAQSDLDNEE